MKETDALDAVQAVVKSDPRLAAIFSQAPELTECVAEYFALGVAPSPREAVDYMFRRQLLLRDMGYRDRAERKFGVVIPEPDAEVSAQDADNIERVLTSSLLFMTPSRILVTKTDFNTGFEIKEHYDRKRKQDRSDDSIGVYTAILVFDNDNKVTGKMPDTIVGVIEPTSRDQEHPFGLEFLERYKVASVVFADVWGTVHANHLRIVRPLINTN